MVRLYDFKNGPTLLAQYPTIPQKLDADLAAKIASGDCGWVSVPAGEQPEDLMLDLVNKVLVVDTSKKAEKLADKALLKDLSKIKDKDVQDILKALVRRLGFDK